MTISFPLTPPSAPGFAAMRFRPRSVVAASLSPFTGEQQVYVHPGQWWELDCRLGIMDRARAEPWIAMLLALNGQEGTLLLGDPNGTTPRGAATGTPVIDGAVSSMVGALPTRGWSTGVTGILKAGDWLQLGSGSTARLHRVLQDANSDGSGEATLDIWPKTRTSYSDGAAIVVTNTVGRWRLKSNASEYDLEPALLYRGLDLELIEALP